MYALHRDASGAAFIKIYGRLLILSCAMSTIVRRIKLSPERALQIGLLFRYKKNYDPLQIGGA